MSAVAGRHARPRPQRLTPAHLAWIVRNRLGNRLRWWYSLPLPLSALLVLLMPWVAVRDMRQSTSAFRYLCDTMLAAHRRGDYDRPPEAPAPRHLHLVQ